LAADVELAGKKVHRLNVGEPDLLAPRSFTDGIHCALEKRLSYGPVQGMKKTLAAWQSYYASLGIPLNTEHMCVTTGASGALSYALKTVLDPGEEVLLFEPFFPNYIGHAQLNSLTPVAVTSSAAESFGLPSVEAIEAKITSRTRAIVYGSPCNPTGAIYSKEELSRLAYIARKHNLFIIADEIYREYAYESPATSLFSIPEATEHAIVLDSVSKRLCACGVRVGLLASRNEAVMDAVRKIAQTCLPPPKLGQYGLIAFLDDPASSDVVAEVIDTFRARRDTAVEALRIIPGAVCEKPAGAFFIIVRLPIEDSSRFARWLLTDFDIDGETILITPMQGFYLSPGMGRSEVRIAYVLGEEELRRAIEVLAQGVIAYGLQQQG
jgi:aspartate aminotransferase